MSKWYEVVTIRRQLSRENLETPSHSLEFI